MSSGESDAYVIKVDNNAGSLPLAPISNYTGAASSVTNFTSGVTSHLCGSWCNHSSTYVYSWPDTYTYYGNHYFYQIKCPKKGCKSFNWLEIDVIKSCYNCGSKLKAVSNHADFEIPVGK
jgi:hypothetical protein